VWVAQAAGLGHTWRLMMPDLPGHGRSGGTALSIAAAAAWLKLLVLQLDLAPLVLVGHSLGSAIAQEFARANPGLLRGLVLAAGGQRLPVPPEYLRLVQDDFKMAVAASCAQAYAPGAPPEVIRRGREMLQRNGAAALRRDLVACASFDSSAWVDCLALPTLVICGSDDKIVASSCARDLACRLPRGRLHLIPGAGHMLMAEAPEEFNAALQRFIEACPPWCSP